MAREGTFNFQECPKRHFIEGSHSNYLQIQCQTHFTNSGLRKTMCISTRKVVDRDNQIMNITVVNLQTEITPLLCLSKI